MDKYQIKKAVFPVAGLGTRFLPATKANPKEMLPIVDKPLIQYAVEEAIDAGIKELIFITSSSKHAIEDHFDRNFELEHLLHEKHKEDLLDIVKNILPKGVVCSYVRQPEMLGLGHAVLCAKHLVCNQPFAILLADDLIYSEKESCLKQLINIFNKTHSSVIAVQNVETNELNKYGVIDPDSTLNPYSKINKIVEKPDPKDAPSNYGVVGRYVITPEIFKLLECCVPGSGGEIQLTDAIDCLIKEQSVYALAFAGIRYDCGNKNGYLKATVQYALKHREVGEPFRKYLQTLKFE